jgi:4-amino-4-deoxy-L-arabinose transferase-like glycosyltransferase
MKESFIHSEDQLYNIFLCVLLAGSILVFFWDIWSIPLLTHNEGRRLVVLREMMANHSWLIPTMNGNIYLEKPPLFYWLGGIFGLLANSTSEWVLRLPSALSAMGLVWLLFFKLKKFIGRWAALFGVLILVTSSFFTMHARLAELEMLLTFCVFSSLLFYFEYIKKENRYCLYGAYALMGLAFLTKGPVALLFFLPPILCYGLMVRSRQALMGLIDWRGWLLFSITAFPWFIYVNTQLQGAPLFEVIEREASTKVAGKEAESFYYYLRNVATGFAPWILVLLWKPKAQFKKLAASDAGQFFGLAALLPLIIFSLIAHKRAKYILPLYPALAVWLGIALENVLEQAKRKWSFAKVALTAFSALLIIGFIGYYTIVQARMMAYRYAPFPTVAAKIDTMRANAPVYIYRTILLTELVYYYGRPIPIVEKKELEQLLADGRPFLLLATNKFIKEVNDPGICQLERINLYEGNNKALYVLAGGSLCRPFVPKSSLPEER